MTDMLALNNFRIPVADIQLRKTYEEIAGKKERSPGGKLQGSTRARLRSWDVVTRPLLPDDAEALEAWVQGRMWHWAFDEDLASDNGMGPTRGHAARMAFGASAFKFSTSGWGMVLDTSAEIATFKIPKARNRSSDNDWCTAAWWLKTAGAWHHFARVYKATDVVHYKDAVPGASTGSLNAVGTSTGNSQFFTLAGRDEAAASATAHYDELVLANWPMTQDQITALATATRAFSRTPELHATGAFLESRQESAVEVRCTVDTEDYLQGQWTPGTWTQNMRTVHFVMKEVEMRGGLQ